MTAIPIRASVAPKPVELERRVTPTFPKCGHELVAENIYWIQGRASCRTCAAIWAKRAAKLPRRKFARRRGRSVAIRRLYRRFETLALMSIRLQGARA